MVVTSIEAMHVVFLVCTRRIKRATSNFGLVWSSIAFQASSKKKETLLSSPIVFDWTQRHQLYVDMSAIPQYSPSNINPEEVTSAINTAFAEFLAGGPMTDSSFRLPVSTNHSSWNEQQTTSTEDDSARHQHSIPTETCTGTDFCSFVVQTKTSFLCRFVSFYIITYVCDSPWEIQWGEQHLENSHDRYWFNAFSSPKKCSSRCRIIDLSTSSSSATIIFGYGWSVNETISFFASNDR